MAKYILPGEAGAAYGLDNSIQAGAKALVPLLGSGLALWLGLRGTFIAVGMIFFLMAIIAGRYLLQKNMDSFTAQSSHNPDLD